MITITHWETSIYARSKIYNSPQISSPNCSLISSKVVSVSSTMSCNRAA